MHLGLTSAAVAERRARDGWNDLPSTGRRGLATAVLAGVREPMTLLLLVCGGDLRRPRRSRRSGFMLLGFVVFIMALTLVQERKTERALEALRDLASPRALVIRDGERVRVAGRELVPDDLVVLAEGDRVPADAVDRRSEPPRGGRVARHRRVGPCSQERLGRRRSPSRDPAAKISPSSSRARSSPPARGSRACTRPGPRTEIGRIGTAMQTRDVQDTSLQAETRRLVVKLAWIGGALSAVAALRLRRRQARRAARLLAGLTLAMAILPERVSRRRHDVPRARRVASVATKGAGASDPGGRVARRGHRALRRQDRNADGEPHDVSRSANGDRSIETPRRAPESMHETVEYSILASRKDPFDPMERAFKELGEAARGHRAPARRLEARARVPADARTARRRAGLARAGAARGSSSPPRAHRKRSRALCGLSPTSASARWRTAFARSDRGPARPRGRARRRSTRRRSPDDPAALGPSLRRARRARRSGARRPFPRPSRSAGALGFAS